MKAFVLLLLAWVMLASSGLLRSGIALLLVVTLIRSCS